MAATEDQHHRIERLLALALLCRRAAATPTNGGHPADRALLALARELEAEAERLRLLRRDQTP